jgi:hypothetical protein
MLEFALALFNGLAAIPVILGYVKDFAAGVMLWYARNSTKETLSEISNAAAWAARAETQEDRLAALDHWRSALSRPRITP